MAAALGTWTALTQSKPRRIEGHTSNVEHPIHYKQIITGTIGETTEAGDTYVIPHKFSQVYMISPVAVSAAGRDLIYGIDAAGAYFADSGTVINSVQTTTAQVAGSTTFVMTTSGSAINDVYNGCFLTVTFESGNTQQVKILDYVGATKTATLDQGLAEAVGTTLTFYTLHGTLMTVGDGSATPVVRFEVTGSFE